MEIDRGRELVGASAKSNRVIRREPSGPGWVSTTVASVDLGGALRALACGIAWCSLPAGCSTQAEPSAFSGFGDGGGGTVELSTGTSTTGGSTTDLPNTATATATDTGGTIKLDVGSDTMQTGGDVEGGCQKIDFLFVVDNSGSMEDEQANLIASFPGFMSTITETLQASFFHLMIVSTDNAEGAGSNTSCVNGACNCTPAPVCCENACGSGATCNDFDCSKDLPITQCDRDWGTGKTYDASGNNCAIDGDRRYMLHTQASLEATFACAANVGVYGAGTEKPMLAMQSALSSENNDAGGCNDGFLRNDAILVVTVITDEEDDVPDGSTGSPPQWVASLVEAKGGNPEAVVFLALVGDSNMPGGVCEPGADPGAIGAGAEAAPRLQAVANGLPFGLIGSVCAPDYTPFFAEAVSVIDASCQVFEPEG